MLAILPFRASKPGAKGFRLRLAARLRHRSPHWGIIHCPDELGPTDVWRTGQLLSETVRISKWRVYPNL